MQTVYPVLLHLLSSCGRKERTELKENQSETERQSCGEVKRQKVKSFEQLSKKVLIDQKRLQLEECIKQLNEIQIYFLLNQEILYIYLQP